MDPNADQIVWREPPSVVEEAKRSIWRPPARRRRDVVRFFLLAAFTVGYFVGAAVVDVNVVWWSMTPVIAGAICHTGAELLPERFRRSAPALRILGGVLGAGGMVLAILAPLA